MSHQSAKCNPMYNRLVNNDGAIMVKVYKLAIQRKPDNFKDPTLCWITKYIYQVIAIVWHTILIVYDFLLEDITDIKESIVDIKKQIATVKPSQQKTAQQNVKCSCCHAHGHQQSKCQTSNPAAVWHWVANNNKAKGQWWATLASSVPPFISIPAPTHYANPLMNPYYANVVSDAHELCQHKQQSNRDWRKSKT